MQIVELTSLSYPEVRFAIDCFEAGGMSAIKPARRGKEIGTNRELNPEQLKMEFALWSRGQGRN